MNFLYNNFWAFLIANFVILLTSAFVGGLAIGIGICFGLYVKNLYRRMPGMVNRYKKSKEEDKKKNFRQILWLLVGHPMLLGLCLLLFTLIIIFAEFSITQGIYERNLWLSNHLYELIPSIKNHTDLAKARGDSYKHIYMVVLPAYIEFFLMGMLAIILNVPMLKQFAGIQSKLIYGADKIYKTVGLYLCGVFGLIACVGLVLLDDGYNLYSGRNHWNSSENINYLFYGFFGLFYVFYFVAIFVTNFLFLINGKGENNRYD